MLTSALKDACINNSMIPHQLIAPICFYLYRFDYVRFPVKTLFSQQDHHLYTLKGLPHWYTRIWKKSSCIDLQLTLTIDTTTFSIICDLPEVGSLPVTPCWNAQGLNMNWRVEKKGVGICLPWVEILCHQWQQLMGGPGVAGSMLFYLKVWKVSLDFEREHMKNTYHGNLLGYDSPCFVWWRPLGTDGHVSNSSLVYVLHDMTLICLLHASLDCRLHLYTSHAVLRDMYQQILVKICIESDALCHFLVKERNRCILNDAAVWNGSKTLPYFVWDIYHIKVVSN